jgi:hypothetical protein
LRPSAAAADARLKKRLRGDLDTIVLKALKKLPAERYGTVDALADDIERHLEQRPVRAQPDSRLYQLSKFIARNRLAVIAAGAVFFVLGVSGTIAVWQAGEANRERDIARREADRAAEETRAAELSARVARAHSALSQFLIADLSAGRSVSEVASQVERAIALIRERYAGDPLLRGRLLADYGDRLLQLSSFERHRALLIEVRDAATEANDALTLARVDCAQARHQSQMGQAIEARGRVERAIDALRSMPARPQGYLEGCLSDASAIARLAGDTAAAIRAIEEVKTMYEAAGLDKSETYADILLSATRAYAQAGRFRDAVQTAEQSVAVRRKVGLADSTGMISIQVILANALREGGQPLRALAILESLIESNRSRKGDGPNIAPVEYERGLTLLRLGRAEDARKSAAFAQAHARVLGDSALIRGSTVLHANALLSLGKTAQAIEQISIAERQYADIRSKRLYIARLLLFAKAEAALSVDDLPAARAVLEEVQHVLDRQNNTLDPAWRVLWSYLARVALREGMPDEALRLAERALALSSAQAIDPAGSLWIGEDLALRAASKIATGQAQGGYDDAVAASIHLEVAAGKNRAALQKLNALRRAMISARIPPELRRSRP